MVFSILSFSGFEGAATLGEETSRRIAERRASAEGREGIAAFLAKRAPEWRRG